MDHLRQLLDRGKARFLSTPEPLRLRILGAALLGVFLLNFSLYATCGWRGCPDPQRLSAYQPGGATVLLDRTGEEYDDLAPVERTMVKLAQLPEHLSAAFVAVEDKRFFEHKGVDWRRVMGAAVRNLFSGGALQGSSTITMQLARNIFNDKLRADDRSLRRKLFEARVARKIERKFSKQEILELYLNHIYFGSGAYGVEAAARQYFRESARDLGVHEAALLAALPKAPSHYDPRERPQRARERRNLVLSLMAEQGRISADVAERASRRSLDVTRDPPSRSQRAAPGGYFTQMVRKELEAELGEEVYRKRFRVFTTLDINAQRAAETLLRRRLQAMDSDTALQGAMVVMESITGDVIALVGGRDYAQSSFNRAMLARRQAGSAFKPFVYGAALLDGYVPSQPILDAPYSFASNGEQWQPRNFDGNFAGNVTMRDALVHSRNVPSARLASAVGPRAVGRFAHDAGIRAKVANTPMIALGITEVTPMELAGAYASFAGMGTRAAPRLVQRVEDEKGKVVYKTRIEREKTIDPAVAFVVTDMLADAIDYGTGTGVRDAGFRGPAAGKTGTTNDGSDIWFVGYTPDLVASLWIGYDRARPLPGDATGGSVAAPLWGSTMREIYRTRPMPRAWVIPGDIETRLVDPATGRVLAEGCQPASGEAREEVFLKDADDVEEICPRGEPRRGLFGAIGAFFAGLFSSDKEQPAQQAVVDKPDKDLGTVQLTKRRSRADRDDRDSDTRVDSDHRDSDRGSDDKPKKKKDKKRGKGGKKD